MKRILVGIFILVCFSANSQTYKFGAGFANGTFFKVVGNLEINDKKVIFETIDKDKKSLFEYDVVKKTNGILYFTDGVMTHFFYICSR